MLMLKVAIVSLLAIAVGAVKKIELQDIEEDNLKSEKEKDLDKSEPRVQNTGVNPLEFLKNGFMRYFDNSQTPQPRYVQQYAVTEQPERPAQAVNPKAQFPGHAAQQAMIGYLSNVPMQIYLVPQYYNDQQDPNAAAQANGQYPGTVARVASYPSGSEHSNFIEVPAYVTPTGKAYIQQPYSSPMAYVYAQPTIAPAQATVSPVVAYPMPVVQYSNSVPGIQKGYYHTPHYTETNIVEEIQEEDESHSHKPYSTHSEGPYGKPAVPEYPRYYSSRAPVRDDHRHGAISELPAPNPLLLKSPPPHLSHLPKALPMYRPLSKPVYGTGGIPSGYARPNDLYNSPYRKRPQSLLDSYIPSNVQLDYLKRGYAKDPLSAYDALSSGRHYPSSPVPRHYERGFLPNQMYHTAAGGITYGHYKRTPKSDKVQEK